MYVCACMYVCVCERLCAFCVFMCDVSRVARTFDDVSGAIGGIIEKRSDRECVYVRLTRYAFARTTPDNNRVRSISHVPLLCLRGARDLTASHRRSCPNWIPRKQKYPLIPSFNIPSFLHLAETRCKARSTPRHTRSARRARRVTYRDVVGRSSCHVQSRCDTSCLAICDPRLSNVERALKRARVREKKIIYTRAREMTTYECMHVACMAEDRTDKEGTREEESIAFK